MGGIADYESTFCGSLIIKIQNTKISVTLTPKIRLEKAKQQNQQVMKQHEQ